MLKHYSSRALKRAAQANICLLLLMLAGSLCVNAQTKDDIYLVDETSIRNVEIIEINIKKIHYRSKSGKDMALNTRQVLMAFNRQGEYLVFPHKEEQVEGFMASSKPAAQVDLIVTLSASVIPGRINTEDELQVVYNDLAQNKPDTKLPTADIAAIIYRDGKHKLFTSPSQASNILGTLSEKIALNRKLTFQEAQVADQRQTTVAPAVQQVQEASAKPAPVTLAASVPLEGSTLVAAETATPAAPAPEKEAPSAAESAAPLVPEKAAPPATLSIDYDLYSRKALQKTKDLGTYLSIVSNRSTGLVEADKAVELAVGLFISENAQVEVSSKTGRTRHKIRGYLNRLKLLKYDRVDVQWTDISYVSDLKKGVDGNYYGIITLQQRFSGFIDGQLVYSDLTEKNIEVVVKGYQKEVNGERQEMWDVFLSDIGVVVTSFD